MSATRYDTFENATEMSQMVRRMKSKCFEYMRVPDELWHTGAHKIAMKSARKMGRRVLASF